MCLAAALDPSSTIAFALRFSSMAMEMSGFVLRMNAKVLFIASIPASESGRPVRNRMSHDGLGGDG